MTEKQEQNDLTILIDKKSNVSVNETNLISTPKKSSPRFNSYSLQSLDLNKIIIETSVLFDIFFGFTINITFAIIFGLFTNNPDLYGDNSCNYLLNWSKITFHYHVIATIFCGIILPLYLYIMINFIKNKKLKIFIDYTITLFRFLFVIASIVIFIGICNSYSKNEECNNLRNLNLAYIIVDSIILFLIFSFMCCMCSVMCFITLIG